MTKRQAKSIHSTQTLVGITLSVLLTIDPSPVFSQQDGLGVNTITVTTRKREENIQNVPLALTAFGAQDLARRNITELEDVARFTAGFAFEDFDGGNANPAIRGQSTLRATAREQTVATFIDGVYMPRSWLVDIGTHNLERIEIVKGPQSARFGRNAFAGAINYIPKKAGNEFEAEGIFTYGNHERIDVGIGVTVPIVEDLLSVRGAFEQTEFDGSWRNIHPNANADIRPGTNGRVGGHYSQTYSVNVLFTPTDFLKLDASWYGFDREEEARATRWLNTGQGIGNCGALQVGGNPSLFCGEYPVPGDTTTIDPRGFGRQSEGDIVSAALRWDIREAFNFTYAFGYVEADTVTANTAEGDMLDCGTILGPPRFPTFCNFQAAPSGSVDYKQQEIRLAYDGDGALTGAIGGFYLNGEDRNFSVSVNVPPGSATPLDVRDESYGGFTNLVFRDQLTDTEVFAVFGEFTFTFPNERTRLSAEGRYTSEEIATDDIRMPEMPDLVGSDTFNFFTPRITVEYDLAPENLIYLTVARGAKAGGFNSNAETAAFGTFDPEFNWTYEAGSKNTFLDGLAVANIAAFYTTWKNQQINSLDPMGGPFTGTLTRNLGNATIWGIEIEGSIQATDSLSFDGAFSFTDATYDDGTIDELFVAGFPPAFPPPCDDIACSAIGDIGGNDLERAPKFQVAAGAQWEGQLTSEFGYYVRADAGYQSSFFANNINAAKAPDRIVGNARAAITHDHVELAIWVRNIGDAKYVSNSLQIIQPFSNNILGSYFGERRTFGGTLTVTY